MSVSSVMSPVVFIADLHFCCDNFQIPGAAAARGLVASARTAQSEVLTCHPQADFLLVDMPISIRVRGTAEMRRDHG